MALHRPLRKALLQWLGRVHHLWSCCRYGKSVVVTGRKIIGATNPADSAPGTIRGYFAIDIGRNIIHGSASIESATKEIALWFPDDVVAWQSNAHHWIYE